MAFQIQFASSEAERQAVYRLRYEQYCERQGLLRERADHDARTLCEPDDASAHLMIARRDDQILGTMRIEWGGDGPFSDELEETFAISDFPGGLALEQVAVGSRFIIDPVARGSSLMVRMMGTCMDFCLDRGVELLFGDCEPHLVPMYRGLGFRTYKSLVNHETSGVLVPLVLACSDLEHLVRVRSPLRATLRAAHRDSYAGDAQYASLLPRTSAILSAEPGDEGLGDALLTQLLSGEEHRPDLFRGLEPAQVEHLLARSDVLSCARGDALIREGHTSRTLYVVLEGNLEVRRGERVLSVASRGDVFGEIAFLVDTRRTADVIAADDQVRVLALSEANLRKLIQTDAELAAKLLLNLARALCYKLATDVPEGS